MRSMMPHARARDHTATGLRATISPRTRRPVMAGCGRTHQRGSLDKGRAQAPERRVNTRYHRFAHHRAHLERDGRTGSSSRSGWPLGSVSSRTADWRSGSKKFQSCLTEEIGRTMLIARTQRHLFGTVVMARIA